MIPSREKSQLYLASGLSHCTVVTKHRDQKNLKSVLLVYSSRELASTMAGTARQQEQKTGSHPEVEAHDREGELEIRRGLEL